MDLFRSALENTYDSIQLGVPYTLTYVSGVGATVLKCKVLLTVVVEMRMPQVRIRRQLFFRNRPLLQRMDPVLVLRRFVENIGFIA